VGADETILGKVWRDIKMYRWSLLATIQFTDTGRTVAATEHMPSFVQTVYRVRATSLTLMHPLVSLPICVAHLDYNLCLGVVACFAFPVVAQQRTVPRWSKSRTQGKLRKMKHRNTGYGAC